MFTQDQYDQLLKLINKDCPTPEKHVAGILYSFLATHEIAYDKWIVDSGATNHMIHDKHMLNETTIADNIPSSKVYLPDGNALEIACIGSCSLVGGAELTDVLYIPNF